MHSSCRISISSHGKSIAALDGFEAPREKITFLFGESGIGKSMLSKAFYGLLDPLSLDVVINGAPYSTYLASERVVAMREHGFFVFQEPSSHLNPLMTIETQIREGSLAGCATETEIFDGLWERPPTSLLGVYPKPHRPSGGEKQRFLLTMAFKKIDLHLSNAFPSPHALFVFDEPTGSLDNKTRNRFLSLLCDRFRQRPFTVLIITHDYSMISEVYRQHSDLLASTLFRELVNRGNGLALLDFSPQTYLAWLTESRAPQKRKPETLSASDTVLLHLKSGIEVFGRRLRFSTPSGECPLTVRKGQVVYLKAASGVGKTTIAKVIMGLIRGQGLDLRIGDLHLTDLTSEKTWQRELWGRKISMVFQHADEALNLNARAGDIFAGLPHARTLTPTRVRAMLNPYFPFEIDDAFLNRPIRFLSGGQKQRLNLLRVLSLDTDLIVLDEPLNGLDFLSIRKVIELIEQKRIEGRGILLISHNEEIFDGLDGVDPFYLTVA
ncbi:MAG: ATP-binding cassette domain-containing protein [candidate division Zixibacteria bacterium]|nr:ATP-binding cassette domain-containing protein [candidate division Zixibacteria bacterium]